MKRIIFILIIIIFLSGSAVAEEELNEQGVFSEEDMFSQEEMIVDEAEVISDDVEEELQQEKLSISGKIKTETKYNNYSAKVDWLEQNNTNKNQLSNVITGTAFFDLRLQNGIKSLLNIEVNHFPEGRKYS